MKPLLIFFLIFSFDFSQSNNTNVDFVRIKKQVPKDKRVVCYYANWAPYRLGEYKFTPEDIPSNLCTHLLYAYATLEDDVGIVPFDSQQDIQNRGYRKFTDLKKTNPDLKTMLSIGGTKEGPARFSKMASTSESRQSFAKTSRSFLTQFGFDGLDLVWQYPGFYQGSSPSDKENYVELVKVLKIEFKNDLCLSMAVPSIEKLINLGFDLPELIKYLDFMNILTYNYHESTEPTVNHVAPLYQIKDDPFKELNIDATLQIYKNIGVDLSKFNLGIALYGVSFFLEDADETDIGSSTSDEGEGSQEKGAVSYNVLCNTTKEESWIIRHVNKSAVGPYAYKNNQWIGYDDEDMIRTKARYAAKHNLGGLMFWTVDMDDFKSFCGSKNYPLIKAGRESFLQEQNHLLPQKIKNIPTPPTKAPENKPCPSGTHETQPNCDLIETESKPSEILPSPPKYDPPQIRANAPNSNIDKNFDYSDDSDNMNGNKTYHSNRDLILQYTKIFVNNYNYGVINQYGNSLAEKNIN